MSSDKDHHSTSKKNGQATTPTTGSQVPGQQLKCNSNTTVPVVLQPSLNHPSERIVHRLVLTGGPCSGKTTGQARLSTFFENLGWKVYCVPEAATTLFSGGIRFPELRPKEVEKFQENLIKVMIAMERTFFSLADSCKKHCLVICDRGIMDATAYMSAECWQKILKTNGWNPVELRDRRYDQIIHLVTAADGAEAYYSNANNPCRTEGVQLARELDHRTTEAWVGHPYVDVLDNSTDFDAKMLKMISAVCRRVGIDAGDRLKSTSRKIKFLVKAPLPPDTAFPPFQDFEIVHDILTTADPKIQARLKKRGQNGNWSYQHTQWRTDKGPQAVELRRQINQRVYLTMLTQRSTHHHTLYKVRRCFLWQQTHFQLDIYRQPCNTRCCDLILLETYTTRTGDQLRDKLPPFLNIAKEVTEDVNFTRFNLALKTAEELKGTKENSLRSNSDSIKTNQTAEGVGKTNSSGQAMTFKSQKSNGLGIEAKSSMSSSKSSGQSAIKHK